MKKIYFFCLILLVTACSKEDSEHRNDNAIRLKINLDGSLQNPAFSPDGKEIVFTRFRNGYNKPPADLFILNLETKELKSLVTDGYNNVNLPGECWNNILKAIVFSAEKDTHDEIYYISDNTNNNATMITDRTDSVSFEPTFSPDGQWVVFESHKLDQDKNGVITKCRTNGKSGYINLTTVGEDCRQPNWSPTGDKILYQQQTDGQWDIWIMDTDGANKEKITNFAGNKTDAVFSGDGKFIFFSAETNDTEYANIYKVAISGGEPVRITDFYGYDGAPSVNHDNTKIIFESCSSDPDKSSGTELWVLNL